MLTCPSEEKLSALVDRELPLPEQRTLAGHVAECEGCAAEAGRLLAVKLRVSTEPQPEASLTPDFWGRLGQAQDLLDAVRRRVTAPRRPLRRRRWAVATAGAALLVVALVWATRGGAPLPVVDPGALLLAHQERAARPAGAPGGSWPAAYASDTWPASDLPGWPSLGLPPTAPRASFPGLAPLPISVFVLPARGFSPAGLQSVSVGPHRYLMATAGPSSLVAWRHGNHWHVLVAELPPWDLLNLAESQGQRLGD